MKRLCEDPAASAELRAELLRSQRAGREYDVEGKLPQLRAACENLQPVAVDELLAQAGAAPVSLAQLWKLALLGAVVGAAVYVAWPKAELPPPQQQQPVALQLMAAATEVPAPPAPSVVQPEAALPRTHEAAKAPSPAPVARSSRREIAQLLRIRALLESDPAAAYRLVRRGEQEFREGLLSEERRALGVLALAASGDPAAAERKAREFFARYPQSPMRERVEAALRR